MAGHFISRFLHGGSGDSIAAWRIARGDSDSKSRPSPLQERLCAFGALILNAINPIFKKTTAGSTKESKVAYLDGLRGVAAFIVYCTHYTAFSHENDKRLHHAPGYRNEYYFAQFPVIRLFFTGGPFAVAIFFAISGYVLSASPLKMLYRSREGIASAFVTQLGCSIPRRFVRLYLPVAVTTFLFMTSWHLFGIQSALPKSLNRPTSYFADCAVWISDFLNDSYIFDNSPGFGQSPYNPHIWTIAEELKGSLIVYTTILVHFALGYGPCARFWANLALFSYFQFLVDGSDYALFVMGMLICDVDLAFELDRDQVLGVFKAKFFQKHRWIYCPLLLLGLYLGSAPVISNAVYLPDETGWAALSYLVSPASSNAARYFCAFSGALCILCIPRIPWLRRIFESSVCQYLGRVSFGFYLVHGPVVWTAGDRLVAAVGRKRKLAKSTIPDWIDLFPISHEGPVGLELNALVPHLVLLPTILWLAAIITKLIDGPSVKLSKRLFQSHSQRQEALDAQLETTELLPRYEEQSST